MRGINTFEDTLRNPTKDIIDWEYIMLHPEVKYEIWKMYRFNSLFALKINQKIKNNELFRLRFYKYFNEFMKEEQKILVKRK